MACRKRSRAPDDPVSAENRQKGADPIHTADDPISHDTVITLNAFQKTYAQKTVLSFPGFSFDERKIYAMIGANGSGKSTFARITAGILPADGGASPFAGGIPTIGYLPQKPYPFRMSVRRNLLLNGSGDKTSDGKKAQELLEELELVSLGAEKANRLSGGETAKMSLARLLMKPYQLLLLDEPTAAMDIHSTLRAENLLQNYCRDTGAAVLLITHSLKQAQRIADEVLFLRDGSLVEYGPAREMLAHPRQAATQEFLDFYGV